MGSEPLQTYGSSLAVPPSILPAADYFARDAFVYEYVGEVVSLISFKKRMRDYAAEGIRHFYFMMLQKDQVRLSACCSNIS